MTSRVSNFCALATSMAAIMAGPALADDAPAADAADAGPPGFKISGHLEAGITLNPDGPDDRLNFGHLFTDKSNQLLLNQALITAEQPLDPKATDYDFGFRFQAMYGTDSRYTHFLNEFDRSIADRNQFDIVEANVQAHLPWLTEGGVDVKLGQYATPIGFEVIDATANTFYSHSYIFNFGIPLKHTGGYFNAHVSDTLDIYLGGDTGVNTFVGKGDNNSAPAFLGGFGLNGLMDGKLTILALAHIGPENPSDTVGFNADTAVREIGDLVATYKYSDELTLTTELNYIHDDGFEAQAFGIAQYASYTLNDMVTLSVRGELFRDDNGFFVAAFQNPLDFVDTERGLTPKAPPIGGGKTTYGEVTLGAAFKAPIPDPLTLTIRPEVRVDGSLNSTRPYIDSTQSYQVTIGIDAILAF
ncbi:MAG TPA: porin [Aliidongia sp.]|nr:porin [Aliidongia sp.]